MGKHQSNLNKDDYAVIRKTKKKTKARPRSSKKLPPMKKEQNPTPDMHPEDAHIRDWINKIVED